MMANANASFYMDYKLNYQSETDAGDATAFNYTRMMNSLYFAASMDRNKRLYIGQSVIFWNKTQKQGDDSADETTLDLLELGPRLHFYLTQNRTWYASAVYNFSAKGTSKVSGVEGDVDGSGYMATLGYHYKFSKTIGIGGSLNYHSVTVDERKVDSSSSDVSETYTAIIPMLEIAFRFR
tara:strand:- start:316300 stop:316839 length:540 start_codon:yes stop_codon:yes gene_type:complete